MADGFPRTKVKVQKIPNPWPEEAGKTWGQPRGRKKFSGLKLGPGLGFYGGRYVPETLDVGPGGIGIPHMRRRKAGTGKFSAAGWREFVADLCGASDGRCFFARRLTKEIGWGRRFILKARGSGCIPGRHKIKQLSGGKGLLVERMGKRAA